MRVLFLQQQPCIRTLKYAVGLQERAAYELSFAYQGHTLDGWYGAGDELFDHWWHLGPDPGIELDAIVRRFRPHVIHSHNLPDRLTVLALEVTAGAVPVIHDVHDLQSLRHTPYEDGFPEPAEPLLLEKAAISGCAALVTVSEEMRAVIDRRHGLPARSEVFLNYALRRDIPAALPEPERPARDPVRIVYQGTLSTNGGHYDLRDLFLALVREGVSLHIHPARSMPAYRDLAETYPGITCHEPVSPSRLMELLPGYDFGWVGFNATLNRAHLDTALPNKLFEYLGCGLPVLTLGHRALARFVADAGVGVSLTTVDGLAPRLSALDMVGLRQRVAGIRNRFTVEANIDRMVSLYESVAR